jgi:hypothetical protein
MFSHQHLPLEEVFDPTGAGDTFAGGFGWHKENISLRIWKTQLFKVLTSLCENRTNAYFRENRSSVD